MCYIYRLNKKTKQNQYYYFKANARNNEMVPVLLLQVKRKEKGGNLITQVRILEIFSTKMNKANSGTIILWGYFACFKKQVFPKCKYFYS